MRVPALCAGHPAQLHLCAGILRLEVTEDGFDCAVAGGSKHHAVNRLKHDSVVMHVFHLNQRIAGGMIRALALRKGSLDLFPVGFRGCKAVVAVAHGKEHRRAVTILLRKALFVFENAERQQNAVDVVLTIHKVPRNMPAFEHKIGIIQLCELRFFQCERLDNRLVRIVDQHEDMRQLDGRAFADFQTRRNTGDNRSLRRTDQRRGTLGIIIGFKIQRHDKASARGTANRTGDEHEALRFLFENAFFEVFAHVLLDAHNALLLAGLFQVGFRQDELQRGRRFADDALGIFPIGRLGSELVAGDNRPLVIVRALFRQ
ncbi:hypothetical protein SDC9_95592 [bioreactor metagenome]|uniref:Uncharacterized protein n=1 Tax=bioreactor metagenome TaxID=1076179 RepID=A0A645A6R5_9ZZZZ